jgi:hypothetical protein
VRGQFEQDRRVEHRDERDELVVRDEELSFLLGEGDDGGDGGLRACARGRGDSDERRQRIQRAGGGEALEIRPRFGVAVDSTGNHTASTKVGHTVTNVAVVKGGSVIRKNVT